jgi:DNA-binding NtrC family response regulator
MSAKCGFPVNRSRGLIFRNRKIGGCMEKSSVAILQHDTDVAQSLNRILRNHFHRVRMSASQDELRKAVASDPPAAVILDIELAHLDDVQNLHRDFPMLPIVCTHRLPDEELWTAALNAGASDVCPIYDMNSVLTSVLRNVSNARNAAA